MTDLREEFEATYARKNGISALQVKFERSATGGYRDPGIRAAWASFKTTIAQPAIHSTWPDGGLIAGPALAA